VWLSMFKSVDPDAMYVALAEFRARLDKLRETLMSREMLLVDQIEVVVVVVVIGLVVHSSMVLQCGQSTSSNCDLIFVPETSAAQNCGVTQRPASWIGKFCRRSLNFLIDSCQFSTHEIMGT